MLVYLIRNTVNGKAYVGQTIYTLEHRWRQHKQQHVLRNDAIHSAIRKYGAEAFEVVVLATADTLEELNKLEEFHIKAQNTLSPNGYNLSTGGLNCRRSAETRAKLSASFKGRKYSQEILAKRSESLKGRIVTAETRRKISQSKTGKRNPKLAEAMKGNQNKKGFKCSAETKAKIGAAKVGNTYGSKNQVIHAVA